MSEQSIPRSATKVDLMAIHKTRHRQLSHHPFYDPRYSHQFPFFGYGTIDMMLRDSRVRFGLGLLKGPVHAYTKFFSQEDAEDPGVQQAIIDLEYHYSFSVESDDEKTAEFVLDFFNAFWADGVLKALKAIEWGYSPNQVVYVRDQDGMIRYKTLINYKVQDARPTSKNNALTGIWLDQSNKYIPLPKSFVHVHERESDTFTGRSRLIGAHVPWHEKWSLGGARDIRRTWFFKCSYDSGTLYVPEEGVTDPDTGETRSSMELGVEIMENNRAGSYRIFPNRRTSTNQDRDWDYEPPKSNPTPEGMLDYHSDLNSEILEGLGIPPEVVENDSSNGMGSATGRKVPFLAFIASITPLATDVISNAEQQILKPLLAVNGLNGNYRIKRIIPKGMQAGSGLEDFESGTDPGKPNPDRKKSSGKKAKPSSSSGD